ncbi:MAG: DUF1826 domain-containing protein [Polyangiaceae bacterium]|nr:DUF1826 domain-containing protein [Polyangiaceae bacterium]
MLRPFADIPPPRRLEPQVSRQTRLSSISGREPQVFQGLKTRPIGMATWNRTIPPAIRNALRLWSVNVEEPFDGVTVTNTEIPDSVFEGMSPRLREWLHNDFSRLLLEFQKVAQVSQTQLTFGPIRSDRCRKFHQDYLRYRLITTYDGPGTEWVPAEAVNQAALVHPPACPHEANAQIIADPAAVRRAQVGDVLLMKGRRHPDGTGIVHRSPPIEASAQSRIALIISSLDHQQP